MHIVYEISAYNSTIESLGLKSDRLVGIRRVYDDWCVVELPDNHPRFEFLKETLVARSSQRIVNMRLPVFSKSDIARCKCAIAAVRMPSGDIPDAVLYPPGICKDCGAGKSDLDAGRITKPKSVKKDFLAPHASEHLLCRTTTWEQFLKPIGVDARPVYSPSGSTLIEGVVRLYSDEVVPVTKPGFEHTVCATCDEKIIDYEAFIGWSPAPVCVLAQREHDRCRLWLGN